MGRLNILGAGTGGFDPGRASQQTETASQSAAGTGQEIEGGRIDGWMGDADGRQALLNILRDLRRGPRAEAAMAGDARKKRPVLAQTQGAQQIFVTD